MWQDIGTDSPAAPRLCSHAKCPNNTFKLEQTLFWLRLILNNHPSRLSWCFPVATPVVPGTGRCRQDETRRMDIYSRRTGAPWEGLQCPTFDIITIILLTNSCPTTLDIFIQARNNKLLKVIFSNKLPLTTTWLWIENSTKVSHSSDCEFLLGTPTPKTENFKRERPRLFWNVEWWQEIEVQREAGSIVSTDY